MFVLPVGTALRRSFDHLTFGRRVGGAWGADSAEAESEVCKASEKWGTAVFSCCAVVLVPPQITRFPFVVHLAAEIRT